MAKSKSSGATGKQAASTVAGVLSRNASERSAEHSPRHNAHQRETAGYVAALRMKPKASR